MKVFLVGMPGSGKSTLGRQLAEKLMLPFLDLDVEIEKTESMSISQIFAQKGEDYFRILESRTLQTLTASTESFIMATGGGAPCFFNGIDIMNASGLTVFLDVSVEELVKRLSAKKDRPLLATEGVPELTKRLEDLASRRATLYRKASIHVDHPTVARILDRLKIR